MTMYIDADLITDETSVAEAILAGIADRLDAVLGLDPDSGWQAEEGQPETHLAEAVGIVIATAAALVQDKERTDYQGFGSLILGIQREVAEPAIGSTLWTFNQTGTYLIPDGSELVMDAVDGTPVGFATVGDVNVTGIQAVDVQVVAIEPGAIANGLLGDAREFEPLPFVTNVEMTTAPSGGQDDQSVDDYLDDIVRGARRVKVVPVLTDDYADTALDVAGVYRAVAVRLLNAEVYPATPASPGHVTIFGVDSAGNALSAGTKAAIIAAMQGTDRPQSVTVHTQDPTVTNLTIAVTIRLEIGADQPSTVAAVQAALNTAYSKANWGFDADVAGKWRAPTTTSERTITTFDVAAVIDDVAGVDAVTVVTINGGSSVTMSGWAPLPNLTGTPTVTVVT